MDSKSIQLVEVHHGTQQLWQTFGWFGPTNRASAQAPTTSLGCRTFHALTATPLAHLRKRELWLNYGQALIDGLSLRQAATRCGVDKDTALRWRHRFLAAAANHRAEREGGIVEADETFFLESFKGQRHLHRPARKRGGVGQAWEHIAVLVVRDRSGQTADFPLERADTQHIAAVLRPLVAPDAILCTDGAAVYKAVSRTLKQKCQADSNLKCNTHQLE